MNSAKEREAGDTKMKRFETTLFASATQEELQVSQILLGLENLIPLPIFIWGFRKRRSCLDEAPCAPPLSVQIAEEVIDEVTRPLVEAEEEDASTAAATSSPATPLSFLPSESDGKFKRSSKKISKKRSRAEFNDEIEELTKHGDLLRVKVENARKQYNKLKSQNLDLKAMKQEALKARQRKEEPQRDMGGFLNLGMDFIQHDETITLSHPQPFVAADQTAHKLHHPFEPIRIQVYSSNNGLESVNRVGPSGIPDLNLTAEEAIGVDSTQPLDVNQEIADKRARFAEARRMRKGIIKIKSMRSACGIKIPRT